MNHRRAMNRVAQIGAVAAGCTVLALVTGLIETGCDSGNGTPAGTGGMTVTGTGGADTSGTGGADNPGTGGAGGSSVACKNDMIEVTADITTNTTWECNSYILKNKVHVLGGATLTIAAGSTIYGDGSANSAAALISTREGKLIAIGTAAKPIVFTSIFPAGSRMPGDSFAGVVMLGKAKINNGTCQNDPDPATTACESPGFMQTVIEGIEATDVRGNYGGNDDTHNCGELRYVRVEFAGFVIGADNELNGVTMGACGSQTKVSYVQVHRGFDDGVEIFGGTPNIDHILITGPTDDGLDWDNGWRGRAQFVIVQQGYGKGDKGMESDNLGGAETSEPRSNPELWNFTFIGDPTTTKIGMHLREGARAKIRNIIVYNFAGGAFDEDAMMVMPSMEWPTFLSIENSVFFPAALAKAEVVGMSTDNDMGFDEAAALMDAARMNVINMDPMFGSTNISAPNYIPAATAVVSNKATPPAPFDTTATYAGAVAPGTTAGAAWYDGWTAFPEN